MSNLKSGYTTGTHATAAVIGVIYEYLYKKELEYVELTLPNQTKAIIEVQKLSNNHYQSIKTDNDDLDVTKGAAITAKLLFTPPQNLKPQIPAKLQLQNTTLFLYGGDGVGIITKKGLKVAPSYPAINPTPLKMIQQNLQDFPLKDDLYIILSIKDGEKIAKETANEKVGVIGGLSILGTTGVVKPISSKAYIDSIYTQMSVIRNYSDTIYLTLGNSAYKKALENVDESFIVEIGNFVYDSFLFLDELGFREVVFYTAIAKMTKIAQGAKNTHNRFGGIDFQKVKQALKKNCNETYTKEINTLKGLLDNLSNEKKECFYSYIKSTATKQLQSYTKAKVSIKIT